VERKVKHKKTFKISRNFNLKNFPGSSSKYYILGESSGYPAADYNFNFPRYFTPLVIMEPDEESSSWQ